MSPLEAIVWRGFDTLDRLGRGARFTVCGQARVPGILGQITRTTELSTRGGKHVVIRGTLVVLKAKLTQKPEAKALVLGPDGTCYRIDDVGDDDVAWNLMLESVNPKTG